jgi:hypothetical protein
MHYGDEVVSLTALKEFLEKHGRELACPVCGEPLVGVKIEEYPHDGGVRVAEYGGERRWVYINHNHCDSDIALWKFHNSLIASGNERLIEAYVEEVLVPESRLKKARKVPAVNPL